MSLPAVEHLAPSPAPAIGLFDSGLGGLSVLRAMRQHLPEAPLLYVADSAHAPYGERSEAFIIDRSLRIAQFLLEQGAQVLVVACNTATAAAVREIRTQHPHVPVVGVEPGVKPAVALSHNGRVGVMATPGTLGSQKFRDLVAAHGGSARVVLQPCPGLAREIEKGELDSPALRDLVDGFCQPLRAADVDTVVLGCTHYPFVAPLIQQAMGPQVHLLDTADAVARHTTRLIARLPAEPEPLAQGVHLWTTGDAQHLTQVAGSWLNLTAPTTQLRV
ncbi:glutamate racemase [Aquabacterium lacunae]|uniref:Glutamate racemase n=1 Tax=Aquabacterium lacunae TaxID=2528630 RepID=A0A4V2JFU0_9BURK|nr:glutamate racemase [Aquabacterium lacunae]TBO32586.1 glutamate racemase [Aquabacterium lacunae]